MGAAFPSGCCCDNSNLQLAQKVGGHNAPLVHKHDGQRRASLQVKNGGFSVGAFATTKSGKLEDRYIVEKKLLGEGSYGSVQKCQLKDTGQWRAVKTINKSMVKNPEQFKEEMAVMKLLDHPNIVRLYESFEDARCVYLVLELCTGGELFDKIVGDGKFSERVAARCVQSMLLAVNYMHQNYIMHRDLKPENWLLAGEQAIMHTDLKLIDFGLAKRFTPGEFATTKAGTPYYVAPEVLNGKYAEKSDVWSIGVVTYILLSGTPPFQGNDTLAVLDAVRRARPAFERKEWKNTSQEAKSMLKALLTRDPLQRPSASQALQHSWLSKRVRTDEERSIGIAGSVLTNLKSFAVMNKLKKASLNVIATQLSDEALKDLKDLFIKMDLNNDGTLSILELKQGLDRAGVNIPADLNSMMEQLDTDGSGVIDYAEFIAATMDRRKYIQEDVCWRAFTYFDVDGNGALDRHEIMRLLSMPEFNDVMHVDTQAKEVDAIFREIDLNGDGAIDFAEFMTMMNRMPCSPSGKNDVGIKRSEWTEGTHGSDS